MTDRSIGHHNYSSLWISVGRRLWNVVRGCHDNPDWKNNSDQTYSCLERLASLVIMGVQLRGPPVTACASQHYLIGGFEGVHNWSPIMPRDASFSDSGCSFSQYSTALVAQVSDILAWLVIIL